MGKPRKNEAELDEPAHRRRAPRDATDPDEEENIRMRVCHEEMNMR